MKHLKKYNEGFVIGSGPLEYSLTLREKIEKLTNALNEFENLVISQLDDPQLDDYTQEVNSITHEISSLHYNIENDVDNLIINI